MRVTSLCPKPRKNWLLGDAVRFRLRTQLVVAAVLVSSAISVVCLLLVRDSVTSELGRQRDEAIAASKDSFARVEQQQKKDLARIAELLSELPTLKALMTSGDPATIQDASEEFWRLSGSDLLALATTDARAMGAHAVQHQIPDSTLQELLRVSTARHEQSSWWQDNDHLYRVALQPIVSGTGTEQRALGFLVVGQQVNTAFAQELAHSFGSQIALVSGDSVVASTLPEDELQEFTRQVNFGHPAPQDVRLGDHHYSVSIAQFQSSSSVPLRCYTLLPLDAAEAFLRRLNRSILLIGLVASLLGAILASLIARAITSPLESLVGAVRALARGDDTYLVKAHGSVEAVELADAFSRMRQDLTLSQRRQMESERMAALGRAAGSISHDLRHHLAALVANAEFLHDAGRPAADREEIYQEIVRASGQMTGLLDSLLEIAREQKTIVVGQADLRRVVRQAIDAVRSDPAFHARTFECETEGATSGTFDARKIERVFYNLLLNSCEASKETSAPIGIRISSDDDNFQCRVWDTGSGIPEPIREVLFEPFVSYGKNNGTGLGLAISAKIIHEHGGSIRVEETSPAGTTFLVTLPRFCAASVPSTAKAY